MKVYRRKLYNYRLGLGNHIKKIANDCKLISGFKETRLRRSLRCLESRSFTLHHASGVGTLLFTPNIVRSSALTLHL